MNFFGAYPSSSLSSGRSRPVVAGDAPLHSLASSSTTTTTTPWYYFRSPRSLASLTLAVLLALYISGNIWISYTLNEPFHLMSTSGGMSTTTAGGVGATVSVGRGSGRGSGSGIVGSTYGPTHAALEEFRRSYQPVSRKEAAGVATGAGEWRRQSREPPWRRRGGQGEEEIGSEGGGVDVDRHYYEAFASEEATLRRVMERTLRSEATCRNLAAEQNDPPSANNSTASLYEFGAARAINDWFLNRTAAAGSSSDPPSRPVCRMPPPKSCHVQNYTAVLMSHTSERLTVLVEGVAELAGRTLTAEIVLVWNGARDALEGHEPEGSKLVGWAADPNHPLRIFYALDHGLPNCLLNRYHPKIAPVSEAIMYFDDDGPFFPDRAMRAGLELWKRNSLSQVGCFPRNIYLRSDRLERARKEEMEISLEQVLGGWQAEVPYPEEGGENGEEDSMSENPAQEEQRGSEHRRRRQPRITPVCSSAESKIDEDGRYHPVLDYNYHIFADFYAHMLLPSGSILHRNYLCFVFHPAFDELRRFVLRHNTHPDDVTISTLVSHLSGKAPRTFPRHMKVYGNESDAVGDTGRGKKKKDKNEEKKLDAVSGGDENAGVNNNSTAPDARHRRLLWKQKGWANMRTSAINEVVGYFGGINAGSVGWCAGTPYQEMIRRRRALGYQCGTEKPEMDKLPWMNEGGLGYDQC